MINGSQNCFFVRLQILLLGLLKKSQAPQKGSKNLKECVVGIFCIEKETGSSCRGFLFKNTLAFLTGGFKEKGEVNRDVYGLLSQVDSCKKVRPPPF